MNSDKDTSERDGKNSQTSAEHEDDGLKLFRMPKLFPGLSPKDIQKIMAQHGRDQEGEFHKALLTLANVLRRCDPYRLLAVLASHALSASVSEGGQILEGMLDSEVEQPDVELVQAMVLSIPFEELELLAFDPSDVQKVWDILPEVSKSLVLKRFAEVRRANTSEQKAQRLLQEALRVHTQRARNWGHYEQEVKLAGSIYGELDEQYEKRLGVPASELVRVFDFMTRDSEKRLNAWVNKLRHVWAAETADEVAQEYFRQWPSLKGDPDELVRLFRGKRVDTETAKVLALNHAYFFLVDVFSFDLPTLAAGGVCVQDLREALNRFTCSLGELANVNHEHIFMANPVWQKPLMWTPDGRAFCPLPHLFFAYAFKSMEQPFKDDAEMLQLCQARRAEFLEDHVANHLLRNLAASHCWREVKWRDGGVSFETDCLAQVGSVLLVVECKSGLLSSPALRGAPERVRRHVNELLVAPAEQSERFVKKVENAIRKHGVTDFLAPSIGCELKDIHRTVRLSVTLDQVAWIHNYQHALAEAGWINARLPVTLTLADLEVVFDILESPAEKLHYMVRRSNWSADIEILSGEMELLALYLENGLTPPVLEGEPAVFWTLDLAKNLDDYYGARAAGLEATKPRVKRTDWWTKVLSRVESLEKPRSVELALALLDIPFADQVKLEQEYKKRAALISRGGHPDRRENVIVRYPPPGEDTAHAIFVFTNSEKSRRHAMAQNVGDQVFQKSAAKQVVVIGVNVDDTQHPYTLLGLYNREK